MRILFVNTDLNIQKSQFTKKLKKFLHVTFESKRKIIWNETGSRYPRAVSKKPSKKLSLYNLQRKNNIPVAAVIGQIASRSGRFRGWGARKKSLECKFSLSRRVTCARRVWCLGSKLNQPLRSIELCMRLGSYFLTLTPQRQLTVNCTPALYPNDFRSSWKRTTLA